MSLAEVAHRSWRLARYPVDVVRARTGTYARVPRGVESLLAGWRGPERFYFPGSFDPAAVDPTVIEAAEACLSGRRVVLGLGEVELPAELWHFEPRAAAWWPRVPAGRVIAAAPPHFDARLTWELNRGHEWVVLARAFSATGDPRFRERLTGELGSWRRQNPIGIGINWASAMEAAIRIHSLAWVAALLRGDPDPKLWQALGRLIHRHVGFVASNRSRFSSANNHLIVELSGIIVGARSLGLAGGLTGQHRDAIAQLVRELDRQIHTDGVNAEMATHYHMFVLEALLLVAFIERVHGQPLPEVARVSCRMADYLAAVVCGNSVVLQQGDNDDGRIVPFLADHHAHQLIQSAAVLEHVERDHSARSSAAGSSVREGARLLTGGLARELEPLSASRSRLFGPSGQVVLRDRRIHVVLDAGPFGFGSLAAHAHCDALAVAVAIDGRRFLVDRGTFRYNGDRSARDGFRMTAAHNTVQVGAREQGDAIGPFLWSRRPSVTLERCELTADGDVVEASHDGFAPSLHRRTLVRLADVLVVVDSITAAPAGEQIVGRWHFAPELEICEDEGMVGRAIRVSSRATTDMVGWLCAIAPQGEVVLRRVVTSHSDLYAARTVADTLECYPGPGAAHCFVTVIGPGLLAGTAEAVMGALRFAADRGVFSEAAATTLGTSLGVR